jgi:hypothetical protein
LKPTLNLIQKLLRALKLWQRINMKLESARRKGGGMSGLVLLGVIGLFSGCVSQESRLVLDPIGPPPAEPVVGEAMGWLLVFSAFDPTPPSASSSAYRRWYTDYKILATDGKLIRTVHNDTGVLLEGPRRVSLLSGNYEVVARANGYGLVTVPVVIRPGQVTTVHLEGNAAWQQSALLSQSNPVRLPDGQIAGWRAKAAEN